MSGMSGLSGKREKKKKTIDGDKSSSSSSENRVRWPHTGEADRTVDSGQTKLLPAKKRKKGDEGMKESVCSTPSRLLVASVLTLTLMPMASKPKYQE